MKDSLRYHAGTLGGRKIMNDNLGDGFAQFLADSLSNLMMFNKGAVYICMSSSELHTLYNAFIAAGGKWSTFIIWAKNTFTLGRADYQRQYEPILYGWNANQNTTGAAIEINPMSGRTTNRSKTICIQR